MKPLSSADAFFLYAETEQQHQHTLGLLVLVDAANFNCENHVQFKTLKAPGDMRQLSDLIGRFSSVPLDRALPLWQTLFVDGLEGGRIAVCTKSHHLITDGVQGAEFMARQFDFEPSPPRKKAGKAVKWIGNW